MVFVALFCNAVFPIWIDNVSMKEGTREGVPKRPWLNKIIIQGMYLSVCFAQDQNIEANKLGTKGIQ